MINMPSSKHTEIHPAGLSHRYEELKQVEEYFIRKATKERIFWSFDCTARENLYFSTLNYTTYAGFFVMHPLQPELSMKQMYDAYNDGSNSTFSEQILTQLGDNANKYNGMEVVRKDYKTLVILPGQNKLDNVSFEKVDWVIKNYDSVGIKPHPITDTPYMERLANKYGGHLLRIEDDLYSTFSSVENVFTTHISETALYAALSGKTIGPIDKVHKRELGSFTHINYFLFVEDNIKGWVDCTFGSHKSGVVSPSVDKDWKQKIDNYFDYILRLRSKYKNSYL